MLWPNSELAKGVAAGYRDGVQVVELAGLDDEEPEDIEKHREEERIKAGPDEGRTIELAEGAKLTNPPEHGKHFEQPVARLTDEAGEKRNAGEHQ